MKNEQFYKKCPFNGERFIPKRRNQVYASAKNRRAFHNQRYRNMRKPLANINYLLYRNHSIIDELIGNRKKIVLNNAYIKGKGFYFKYFTHITIINNQEYFGLYNFIYIRINESETKFINYDYNE